MERPLIRTLPDVALSDAYTPVHQEFLDTDCDGIVNITTQGQEFIATSSDEWWLEVYGLSDENNTASFLLDSVSEISDDAVLPKEARKALWRAVPRDPDVSLLGRITFLAPDVIGLVQLENRPAAVSTWNVRSGQYLGNIVLRGEYRYQTMCKISDTEFVVGGEHGHLFCFEHEGGRRLRETQCIWKAHTDCIWSISLHNGMIVTTSLDWTARLWDAETKKRIAVLYHDGDVLGVEISDQYIVTCSRYSQSTWEKSELRVYRNSEGYPLAKILRAHKGMFAPTLLDGGRVLCVLRDTRDEDGRSIFRDTLLIVDFENELVLAQLKVGCRGIIRYNVLPDGRLVAIGRQGCPGVIATLPRELTRLINPKLTEKQSKTGRRRMCTLM